MTYVIYHPNGSKKGTLVELRDWADENLPTGELVGIFDESGDGAVAPVEEYTPHRRTWALERVGSEPPEFLSKPGTWATIGTAAFFHEASDAQAALCPPDTTGKAVQMLGPIPSTPTAGR